MRFADKPISLAESGTHLESRSLADLALKDFISTNLARTFQQWPPREWGIDELTLAAIYFQPNLAVARAQWRVAQASVKTAGGRPNPTISVTPEYNVSAASGISPWAPAVSFDFPIETAGKRNYRIARAGHLTEAARLQIFSEAWRLHSQLVDALTKYKAAQSRLRFLESRAQAQQQVITSLEQRLAAGAVAGSEVAIARLIFAKSRMEHAIEQGRLIETRAAIAAAIGVSPEAVSDVEFRYELPQSMATNVAHLRQVALQQRADVRAALAEYDASQAALQLEIAKQWPDVHLGPGYQWDQGESKWSIGLSVELPVLNQNQGPIAEAMARRVEAAARVQAAQAKVITQLASAEAAWRSAKVQVAESEAVLAAHREELARIESAQKLGGADRLEAMTARLNVIEAELFRQDATIQAGHALNGIEAALQTPLPLLNAAIFSSKTSDQSASTHSPRLR